MGSWNATCGMSQQSIGACDKVVAYVILNNVAVGDGCYGQNIAQPISFPIHAKYDDYGGIENVKNTFGARSTLMLFNKWGKEGRLKGTGRNKDGVFEQFDCVESIFGEIQEGMSVELPHPYQILPDYVGKTEIRSLGYMLNLKSATLSAWETVENDTSYDLKEKTWDNFLHDAQLIIDKDINKKVRTFEEVDALYRQAIADQNEQLVDDLYDERFSLKMKMDHGFRDVWGKKIKSDRMDYDGNWVGGILTSRDAVHEDAFVYLYDIAKETFTDDQNDDLKTAIAQMLMNHCAMFILRKSWAPQGHTSQFDTVDSNIEYMERQLKRLYAERVEQIEDMDEEEREDYKPPTITHKELSYNIAVESTTVVPVDGKI